MLHLTALAQLYSSLQSQQAVCKQTQHDWWHMTKPLRLSFRELEGSDLLLGQTKAANLLHAVLMVATCVVWRVACFFSP